MFKKFSVKEDITNQNLLKTSVQRGIRAKILEQYPGIADHLDSILPKKQNIVLCKCRENISLVAVNNVVKFYNVFDGPWYPTLRVIHQFPDILPKVWVDKGAIPFVLKGAQIMCPGLTSPGAKLPTPLPAESIVTVMAEGKEHAVAIGVTKLSTEDMVKINKGCGVDNIHYLGDGLWKIQRLD